MRNIKDSLGQIIDNLLLIKNIETDFSQIDKDILLQNIREAYLTVLQMPVVESVKNVENQEETKEITQEPASSVDINEKEQKQVEEEKVSLGFSTEISESETDAQAQQEEDNDEMDTDILEFITEVPKNTKEPEIKFEDEPEKMKVEEKVEEMPPIVVEPEPAPEHEPEPVIEPKPVPELKPEPTPVIEPVFEPESEPEPIPESKQMPEPEPAPVPEPQAKPQPEPVYELKSEPQAVKPQQRSLNDLFNEQKQDLGDKFQQTKINDLTKAMSINDKFLFIRELFKNKSEEFSRAIHTLNNCENIEEAFDIMEGLKKQYFWDSTSSAYLALCDLVRRKF